MAINSILKRYDGSDWVPVHLQSAADIVVRPNGHSVESDLSNFLPEATGTSSAPVSTSLGKLYTDNNGKIYSSDVDGRPVAQATEQYVQDNKYVLPSIEQNDTASAVQPEAGGDVTVIDSITRDSNGRVTGINLKTVTLPTQESITGAASTVVSANLAQQKVVVSDDAGKLAASSVTTEELNALSGVTGSVQSQIDSKAPTDSPALTGNPTAPTKAVGDDSTSIATTAFVVAAVNNLLNMKNAFRLVGSLDPTSQTLPSGDAGDVYRIINDGTINGLVVHENDTVTCAIDGTSAETPNNWYVTHTNHDGSVFGPASSVDSHVVVFDGSSGNRIKDSGFTIEKSVPADAAFTDTVYTHPTTKQCNYSYIHPSTIQCNAATNDHKHSASDITSGTLPLTRGGTGVTSLDELKSALGISAWAIYPEVGNIVKFDNKIWRCVHYDASNKLLYLGAEEIVSLRPFGSNNIYNGSTLASAAATYQTNKMSPAALSYCADVTVEGVTAKVFVPSYEQVNGGFSYFTDDSTRLCYYNGRISAWWTSSPIDNSVFYVDAAGDVVYSSASIGSTTRGFRPFIALNV